MMSRGRKWVKEAKKELKRKKKELKEKVKIAATESEKLQLAKNILGDAYDKYEKFIGLIPEVEERIQEIKKELAGPGVKDTLSQGSQAKDTLTAAELQEKLRLWEKVLTDLEHVRDRPKAMKLYYAKRVLKQIKKIKEKYPG